MLDSVEQPVKEETVRNRKRVGKMEWSMSRKKKGREKQNRNEKKKGEKERERGSSGPWRVSVASRSRAFFARELFFAYYSVCTGLELAKVVCC